MAIHSSVLTSLSIIPYAIRRISCETVVPVCYEEFIRKQIAAIPPMDPTDERNQAMGIIEILGIIMGIIVVGIIIYVIVDRIKDEEDEPEPVPPFIEEYSVSPEIICSSSENSCGASVSFVIGGDFEDDGHTSSLTLESPSGAHRIMENEASFTGVMNPDDFPEGPGRYLLTATLNQESEEKSLVVFRETGSIEHRVTAVAEKADQDTIGDGFTIGHPRSGADHEVCDKVMYLDAVELSDQGLSDDPVMVRIGSLAERALRPGERYSLGDPGMQFDQSKVLIYSFMRSSEPFDLGDERSWTLVLHFHC